MSSFLEDLNAPDDSGSASPQSHSGESPFLIGLNESDAAPSAGGARRSGTVALVVALACAGGGLYLMRTVGLSASVALADTEIDYTLQHGVAAVDHGRLISDLQRSDDVVQIPLNDLPMNPFAWNAVQPVEEADEIAFEEPEEDQSERLRRERLREIESAFGLLTLNSVLSGPRPVVRISGETYAIGDVVEGFFTIEKVEGRSVTLSADGRPYELTMGQ